MASVPFFGEQIRLADEPNEFVMAEFARSASTTDSNDMAALGAVMDLLESCVSDEQMGRDANDKPTGPTEWQRFRLLARKNRAQIERDLMPVVVRCFEAAAERPTQQPSDSSAGLPSTAPNSPAASSPSEPPRASDPFQRHIDRLDEEGRPDLALFLVDAQRARSTA